MRNLRCALDVTRQVVVDVGRPSGFERRESPMSPIPKPSEPSEDGSGPRRPDSGVNPKDNLLKRMRKVDPKQAERYRQRTGE